MAKPVDLERLQRLADNPPEDRKITVSPSWLRAVARELEAARGIKGRELPA